jgi:hypothetical protein
MCLASDGRLHGGDGEKYGVALELLVLWGGAIHWLELED